MEFLYESNLFCLKNYQRIQIPIYYYCSSKLNNFDTLNIVTYFMPTALGSLHVACDYLQTASV